ncbi:37S ribosomal protein S23 mitochondrial [Blyttiomyces sp. JEL0837]|nr:37S ribosomal protein S23 mitochondrial [Blyttiomyces sp. JEL0837]
MLCRKGLRTLGRVNPSPIRAVNIQSSYSRPFSTIAEGAVSKKQQRKEARKEKESSQPVVADAKEAEIKTTTTAASTRLNLPEWEPSLAVSENVGKVFQIPPSNDLFRHSSLQGSGLMLRESSLNLMDAVNGEIKKPQTSTKICLDGPAGAGKSSSLGLLSAHFQKLDWIVLHLQNPSHWLAAKEPYAKDEASKTFTQSQLTSKVLGSLLKSNQETLKKVAFRGDLTVGGTKFTGSLLDLVTLGSNNQTHSHSCLEALVKDLLDHPESRPPVLVAVDQVNSFYSKTAYFDTDSTRLTSDQFAIVNSFAKLLTRPSLSNMAVIAATDRTDPAIKSAFFDYHLETCPTFEKSSSSDKLSVPKYQSMPGVENSPALLPHALAPAANDVFMLTKEFHPVGLTKYVIPSMSKSETVEFLRHHQTTTGRLHQNKLSQDYIIKTWMISGGNPGQIIKGFPLL